MARHRRNDPPAAAAGTAANAPAPDVPAADARAATANGPDAPAKDVAAQLAYDAGVSALEHQSSTLADLRNRASGVLTAAALVASVGGGLGLVNTDPTKGPTFPLWAALTLVGILVVIGALTIAVAWPVRRWAFGLNPGLVLDRAEHAPDEAQLRRTLATEMADAMEVNRKASDLRSRLYRAAASLLVVEVGVLALALRRH